MNRHPAPRNSRAILSLSTLTLATGIALSLPGYWGALPMAALIWSWLSVLHSAGHRAYFRSRVGNAVAGHLASVFTFVPFYPWRYHHAEHHTWTGYVDRDPTATDVTEDQLGSRMLAILNFCWKTWFPVFSLLHVAMHLWNPAHLRRVHANDRRFRECLLSLAFVAIAHALLIALIPGSYLRAFLPGLGLFLVICDPVLLSQHSRIPFRRAGDQKVVPLRLDEHEPFTRSFTVHPWIDRWVFLNFNLHNAHHRYPNVAHYDLEKLSHPRDRVVPLFSWVMALKKKHVREVLFGAET